jgi:hypothetical protein
MHGGRPERTKPLRGDQVGRLDPHGGVGKRGPKTSVDDATVVTAIREVLATSTFHTEGHRKVRVRLRLRHGLAVGNHRVLRLMRAHRLLAPHRRRHTRGDRTHQSTIITTRPDAECLYLHDFQTLEGSA